MIKKLRRKFILTNMLLVALVLIIVFTALCLSNWRQLESSGEDQLRLTFAKLDGPEQWSPPRFEMNGGDRSEMLDTGAAFVVKLDDEGGISSIESRNYEVDEELAQQAAAEALESGETSGLLNGLDLRYMIRQTADGKSIAFLDVSRDMASFGSLVLLCAGAFLGGLAAFFLISLFLSRLALRPAERAWEQQRQFVADASHELKTPLTVILANAGILAAHPEETVGQQMRWVENTRAEAQRMKGLVDDMLFLAKADAAAQKAARDRVNLTDLVWSCELPFEALAFEKGVKLDSDIVPGIWALGDEKQLKQLTAILLDNACKYAGDRGEVRLRLEKVQDRAVLTVKNTGEPISPEQLKHVFERFYRADASRAREQGGYGLGLAIASRIAENHGGRLSAESSAEKGTVFTFTMKCEQ